MFFFPSFPAFVSFFFIAAVSVGCNSADIFFSSSRSIKILKLRDARHPDDDSIRGLRTAEIRYLYFEVSPRRESVQFFPDARVLGRRVPAFTLLLFRPVFFLYLLISD